MKMRVNDFIAAFLKAQEITHVFEMAGGMITHLLDAIYHTRAIDIISVHHEQAAAFAADGFGRLTGKPGVALATSGPGATNLLTGIGNCYFDSVPALFFTGQVNQHEQKGSRAVRQLGFQETDIISMAKPITKKCFAISKASEIEPVLLEAYQLAMEGRQGPVLIDIPMNLQRAEIDITPSSLSMLKTMTFEKKVDNNVLSDLKLAIQHSQRPVILAGRGVVASRSCDKLIHFAEETQIPVVTSLLALESIPFDHPLRVGFIGSYGNRWANIAIGTADLLIVLGSRLDIRQTGADVEGFKKDKIIYHIDCDENEINNRVTNCVSIVNDVGCFLDQCLKSMDFSNFTIKTDWIEKINHLKQQWPDIEELKDIDGINPNHFISRLSERGKDVLGYVADVGNHQMWAAQSLRLLAKQFFMTSAGMGAMGYALPAAIGACFSTGKKPVVMIAGDGGFQLNIQELQTIVHHHLPLKLIVLNNNSLGMIRQFQDSYFDGRYQSTAWGYSAPDFEKIARAYGIESKTINESCQIEEALESLFKNTDKPALLQVMIHSKANAYPKIAFGKPITEMEPFSEPIAMEGT